MEDKKNSKLSLKSISQKINSLRKELKERDTFLEKKTRKL